MNNDLACDNVGATYNYKRDLTADLAICDAATRGEWDVDYVKGTQVVIYDNLTEEPYELISECETESDARFIAEARTGWPHAIERAIAAEGRVAHFEYCALTAVAENERLRDLLDEILDDHDCALSTRELIEEALDHDES